jgi:hypothetical protein
MTKYFAILIFLFSSVGLADDMGQIVSGQDAEDVLEKGLEKFSSQSPFVSNGMDDDLPENFKNTGKRGESVHVDTSDFGEFDRSITEKQEILDNGTGVLGEHEDATSLYSYKNKDIVKRLNSKGREQYSFSYLKDNYSYDKENSRAESILDGDRGLNYGALLIGYNKYFSESSFRFMWGINVGLGFASGKGDFSDGASSEVDFKYYTVPVDISLGLHIPMSRFLGLKLSGGPSALGVYQTRSDGGGSSKKKSTNQVGLGYFAEGRLAINMSQISNSIGFRMFRDYEVSGFTVDLFVRHQNYTKFFQEGLSVSGSSGGLGLSFEYL